MIEFKSGVCVHFPINPKLERIFVGIDTIWKHDVWGHPVVTAGNDGKHMAGSLHYKDLALDLRSRSIPTQTERAGFRDALSAWLGPDYDVIFEAAGTENEHFHVEADGKASQKSA